MQVNYPLNVVFFQHRSESTRPNTKQLRFRQKIIKFRSNINIIAIIFVSIVSFVNTLFKHAFNIVRNNSVQNLINSHS